MYFAEILNQLSEEMIFSKKTYLPKTSLRNVERNFDNRGQKIRWSSKNRSPQTERLPEKGFFFKKNLSSGYVDFYSTILLKKLAKCSTYFAQRPETFL